MSLQDSNFDPIAMADDLPEYKMVDSYFQCLVFVFKMMKENAPYHLLTPQFRIEMDNVQKAIDKFRVEYARNIRFGLK